MARLSKRTQALRAKVDSRKLYPVTDAIALVKDCLLYTSPSPRDRG